MDWTQTLTIIGVVVALFGVTVAFFIYQASRIDKVIDQMGSLDKRMTTLESEVKHTNQRLTDFQMQVNQRFNTLENYIIPKKIVHEEPKEN